MTKQIGLDMELYRNAGTIAAPDWILCENVRDLTAPDSMAEADVSCRGSKIAQIEPAQRQNAIDFEMVYDPTEPTFAAIMAAYAARSPVEFAMADGPIGSAGSVATGGVAGTGYTRLLTKILKFERNEALTGANLYSVSAKPCWSNVNPSYNTVS